MKLKFLIFWGFIFKCATANGNISQSHDDKFENLVTEVADQRVLIDHLRLQLEALEDKCNNTLNRLPSRRSCAEHKRNGMTDSGWYNIDPDGGNSGNPPFRVFCDMSTGSTLVHHNVEKKSKVAQCNGEDCFSLPLQYDATMSQMLDLIQVSTSCTQDVKFECYNAPLYDDLVNYGAWLNRHGRKEHYWDGSHHGQHVCQCDGVGNCADPRDKCNCDANDSLWDVDEGVLTDTNALPVTGFTFYGLVHQDEMAFISFGPLKCSGEPEISPGNSCYDLMLQGQTISGFYQVSSGEKLGTGPTFQTVFCDFSRGLQDPLLQLNVLPPVKFEVIRDDSGDMGTGSITYDRINYQYGGNYIDLQRGQYTAPYSGTYRFFFQGLTAYQDKYQLIYFMINGHKTECVLSDSTTGAGFTGSQEASGSIPVYAELTRKLQKGDTVSVEWKYGGMQANSCYQAHFGGELLFL